MRGNVRDKRSLHSLGAAERRGKSCESLEKCACARVKTKTGYGSPFLLNCLINCIFVDVIIYVRDSPWRALELAKGKLVVRESVATQITSEHLVQMPDDGT